ncbi:integrase catalytic domain-containing protein [Trichonephila clavipes]|nr:integrase catalytic domain-containing protein [Trichonephila clavipes]
MILIIEEVFEGGREGRCHYLPRRGVFEEFSTTQPRPVFDVAFKEKGKFSLIDCVEKGLNLLNTIPSILMKFRQKKIGIISDIKKDFYGSKKKDLLFWDTSHRDAALTIVPKLSLQETWRKKLDWDERLPMNTEKKMMQWLKDSSNLNIIKIPRRVIPIEFRGYYNYSMHTFSDASSSRSACVVYLRTEGKGGVSTQLLQAKS